MPVAALKSQVKKSVEQRLDRAAVAYLQDSALSRIDFAQPPGEPSLSAPDSVSWRIFKNPVSLFIGGVAAVLLEFAEPRVRSGVWEHSNFRINPVARMKRTGLAAMVTVYGPRSVAERMIENVNRMHARVAGVTPSGDPYTASDPVLLTWVQATAAFGFLEAYAEYVAPISDEDRDRYYADGRASAALYGAHGAPASLAEQRMLFSDMLPALEPSDIIFEFREIMRRATAFPPPAHYIQRPFVRAAVDLLPADIRDVLGLGKRFGLRPFEKQVIRRMAQRADRLALISSPPARACVRLGLPADYLYRR